MKKFFTVAVFALLTLCSFAQDGKSIYQKYSDMEGVSAVYISPSMFRMIGRLPDVSVGGDDSMDLTPLIKSLRGMYILTMENTPVSTSLADDVRRFVGKGRYDLLMEVKDDGEQVRIYVVSQNDMISSLVLLAAQSDECTFICVDGNIPLRELEKMMSNAKM